MAKTIYTVEELELLNGKTITIKPLSLKKLRQANKLIRTLNVSLTDEEKDELSEEDQMDLLEERYSDKLVALVQHCAEIPTLKNEDADDVVDADTAYRIIEVSTGVKLNDENLIKMAMEFQETENDSQKNG